MGDLIERLAREAIEKAAIWSDGPPGNRDRYIPPAHPRTLEAIAAALRAFQAEAAKVARETREIPGVDFNPEAGEKSHGEEIAVRIEAL